MAMDSSAVEDASRRRCFALLVVVENKHLQGKYVSWPWYHHPMPKRKPVEAAEPAPVVAEPKKTVRKRGHEAEEHTDEAAHKHHSKKTVEPVMETPTAAPISITREAIAQLAYSYWEARGRQDGSPDQDWLRAEQRAT